MRTLTRTNTIKGAQIILICAHYTSPHQRECSSCERNKNAKLLNTWYHPSPLLKKTLSYRDDPKNYIATATTLYKVNVRTTVKTPNTQSQRAHHRPDSSTLKVRERTTVQTPQDSLPEVEQSTRRT